MKLGLGTVQFGLDYGAFNTSGRVAPSECGLILDAAESAGVKVLDTAAGYGNSEEVLGSLQASGRFSIISKVPAADSISAIEGSVLDSLARLGARNIYGMLFHRADDLLSKHADKLWHALTRLREDGVVKKIGFSAYDPSSALQILERFDVDIIQVPINVLDRRFAEGVFVDHVDKYQVEVHARSVFLQGFLLANPNGLSGHLAPYEDMLRSFLAACSDQEISPLQAAVKSVASLSHVNRYIVGVQSVQQLKQLLNVVEDTPCLDGIEHLSCDDINLIDPSKWVV